MKSDPRIGSEDLGAHARRSRLQLHEGAERVPLTIADYDAVAGTITLVVQALGRSTAEMRDHYHEGDEFTDVVGPLGVPTDIEHVGHVVLVGGGLGVAPIYWGSRTTLVAASVRGWKKSPLGFHNYKGVWLEP